MNSNRTVQAASLSGSIGLSQTDAFRFGSMRTGQGVFRQQAEATIKLLLDGGTGKIIDANEAAIQFYGWSLEEL